MDIDLAARYSSFVRVIMDGLDLLERGPVPDGRLRSRVVQCLDIMDADAVAVIFSDGGIYTCCCLDLNSREAKKFLENPVLLNNVTCRGQNVWQLPDFNSGRSVGASLPTPGGGEDVVVIAGLRCELETILSGEVWYSYAVSFRELFKRRRSVFRHFPNELSYGYWENWGDHTAPWCSVVRTITLSLDLRKSTFAMDQAESNERFAEWMEGLVKDLTGIAREHLAVFDKFTGDGVIVHFLENDVEKLRGGGTGKGNLAMESAVHCAGAMVGAVEKHLTELRKFLHNDSRLFGAGIGIAVGDAYWDLDHAGSPIVVGRGVVGACRVGDKACAGVIRMTNLAYQKFKDSQLGARVPAKQVRFASKDLSDDLEVQVWELLARDVRSLAGAAGC